MGAHHGLAARRHVHIVWPANRLIAAMLVIFVLGIQFMNALSTSHSQLEHGHSNDSAFSAQHVVDPDGHSHDDDAATTQEAAGGKHTHKHKPGDHTHDVPLRLVLASAQFTFTPDWHTAPPCPVVSTTLDPLERPPKATAAA